MRPSVRSILFTGMLAMVANSLMVAQTSNGWAEQWYRAKYGHPSPTEEARLKDQQANTAYREETTTQVEGPATNSWYEEWYRAKFGRPSPTEEARLKDQQASTAYREETTQVEGPTNSWYEGWYRAKYGRPSPAEEARLKAQVQ